MSTQPAGRSAFHAESSVSTPAPQETSLLLVGMDEEALALLRSALLQHNVAHATDGPMISLACQQEEGWDLLERLAARFSAALRARIRVAWMHGGQDREARITACAAAQAMEDALEQRDAAWLRAALQERRLFSVFQPIVDVRAAAVHGHEAFIRCLSPDGNETVSAGQLLFMASRLGLRHAVEMTAAFAALEGAAAHGLGSSLLFVNISPLSLYDPLTALAQLRDVAQTAVVAPDRLVFEVADFAEMAECEALSAWCARSREIGVRVALDRAPANERSLDLLRLLAPDYVKFDGMMAGSGLDGRGRRRLDRLVQVASAVGTQVVAEGIETVADARMCLEAGVQLMQGFLFGQPHVPPRARMDRIAELQRAA